MQISTHSNKESKNIQTKTIFFKLPYKISNKINELSNKSNHATYIILVSAVSYIIYKNTQNPNVIVSSPMFIKNNCEQKDSRIVIIDFNINTDNTFKEHLMYIKRQISNSYKAQETTKVIERKDIQTVVLLENIHYKYINNTSEDFIFKFDNTGEFIQCQLEYNCEKYEKDFAENIIVGLISFYNNIISDFNMQLSQIDFNSKEAIHTKKYLIYEDEAMLKNLEENIVLLRNGANIDKHIFFIHDVSGGVESYIQVCDRLDKEYYCWGIKADKIKDCCPQNLSINNIAKAYLEGIKTIVPFSSFSLIGWSDGGIIAYEIARLVEQANEKIHLLSIIDSQPPSTVLEEEKKQFNIESEVEILKQIIEDSKITKQLSNFANIKQLYTFLSKELEYISNAEEILKNLPEDIKRIVPTYKKMKVDELLKAINLIRSIHKAKENYALNGKIKTVIHAFIPERTDILNIDLWSNYSINSIKKYNILGDHYTVLKLPQVKKLAELMNELL